MRTFRYILRFTVAFITKFKGLIIIGIILGIIFFLLGRVVSPFFLRKTIEKIGVTGRYHTENLPNFILNLISDGLTSINEDGTVVPKLAYSWETPDKGKTWIFTLKNDIFWQDDVPITSGSIVYEFSDVDIEYPNDKTVTFELKNPFSPFPSVVSKPTFRKGLLGTGEWRVENILISGGIIQELELIDNQKNRKIFKFYPTEDRAKLAFKLGEVDKLVEIFNPSPFDIWNTAKVETEIVKNRVVTVFFNFQDPDLSEKNLRQALIYAIDKEKFGNSRAISPIPSNSWAFNPQVKKYSYNKERAKELLEDLPKESLDNLDIELVSNPVLLPVAEEIEKFWEEIGIKTTVLVSSIIPSDFQAYLTILDLPQDPDQYSIWHSTQKSSNISNYSNPRIDKLLEDGRSELNFEERRKIYLDFQRFLIEDSPAAFLYHPPTYTISRK